MWTFDAINTVSIDAGEIIEEELDAAMRGLEDAFEDETESTGDMKKRIEQIFETCNFLRTMSL